VPQSNVLVCEVSTCAHELCSGEALTIFAIVLLLPLVSITAAWRYQNTWRYVDVTARRVEMWSAMLAELRRLARDHRPEVCVCIYICMHTQNSLLPLLLLALQGSTAKFEK
jgi:hypothetical protein